MIVNLFGLGDPGPADLSAGAEALLKAGPLSAEKVRDYFLVLPKATWRDAGLAIISKGGNAQVTAAGLRLAQEATKVPWNLITGALTLASAGVSAYHGTRRNDSIGWGVWWFAMGLVFPIFTPIVGLAQGYARPKKEK